MRPDRFRLFAAPSCLAVLTVLLAASSTAQAQLTPDRLYYGFGRTIPMTVAVPADAQGEVEIALLAPPDASEVERASAAAGKVDLAALFPTLWSTTEPRTLYAQLIVGDVKIGPAVVLQPLLTPLEPQKLGQKVAFAPNPNRVYSGIRAWTDRHIVFDTSAGELEVRLRPDQAPNTCWTIIGLVEGGFYTDIAVHRIIPRNRLGHPFVVQFGDPTSTGSGTAGFYFDLEPSELQHGFGVLGVARNPEKPNSNSCQLFFGLSREGTAFLDHDYIAFGELVRGASALITLERTPLADFQRGKPKDPPPLVKRAWTVPAPPYGEGPPPLQRPALPDR